jgi:hypothetical protein
MHQSHPEFHQRGLVTIFCGSPNGYRGAELTHPLQLQRMGHPLYRHAKFAKASKDNLLTRSLVAQSSTGFSLT